MAPWWDGLDAATLRRLRDRYPGLSFEEMAVHALRLPAYADDFADLGAQVMSVPDVDHIGTRREDHEPTEVAWFPFNTEQAGRALLVMALLADTEPVEANDLVGGVPYAKTAYTEAGKLHAKDKLSVQGIEKRTGLKHKRTYRIYRQFRRVPSSSMRWGFVPPLAIAGTPPSSTRIRPATR
jgi:hypothetical protein